MSNSRIPRILTPTIAAAALLALAGCAGTAAPAASDTPAAPQDTTSTETNSELLALYPEEIREAGVLRVGVSPNFPPGNFEEDDGSLNGSDIQLGLAMGEVVGIEIEHVPTNFAGLLTGLDADRFDVVISGMSDTLEREQQVTFVNYLNVGSNFLVPAGNPEGIDAPTDLCGLVAAETIGTNYIDQLAEFSDDCVTAGEAPIDVQTFQSGVEVTQAVASGRADFSFASLMANTYFAQQSEGALASVGQTINPQLTGIVVPNGEDELVEALKATLQEMLESGQLADLMAEWELDGQVVDEIQVNGATS